MRDEQSLGPSFSLRNRAVDRYLSLPCLLYSGGFERKYFAEINNELLGVLKCSTIRANSSAN
jgi:hypothetical protein